MAKPKQHRSASQNTTNRRTPAHPIVDPIFPNPAGFVLPAGILRQDFDMIDDQENHIVLTVRIPKEVIRKNQLLLHALMEMSAPTWSPAEPEKGDLDAEGRQHATQ
jgi:hypothetical protein